MQEWSEKMKGNKGNYIQRCLERLAPMEGHANRFSQSPWDVENLRQLGDHFHQIAGSSGVYEMQTLTPIAEAGERLCRRMYENPPDDVIVYWRNLREMIAQMRTVLEGAAGGSHPGMAPATAFGPPSGTAQGTASGPPPGTASGTPPGATSGMPPGATSGMPPGAAGMPPGMHPGTASGGPPGASAYVQPGPSPPPQIYAPHVSPHTVADQRPDIVVVSSDQNRLQALAGALNNQGMRVRPCGGWQDAKAAIMSDFPDGLLVCVPLQDGNGYDLIAGCRSLPAGDSCAIVLLSEEQGFLDKIGAIRSGADAFFELPIEVDVIVDKIRFLFERGKPERYRILSVEDDPDQADYIVTTLQNAGYHVLWQQDPRRFEEALLTFCPDLLLLDIVMGDITGFELARFVRQNERFAAIPILFLTTQNQLEAHIESARAGGDDHLIKPVNPQLLVATIAGKLERYRIFQKLLRNDGLTQILNHSHFMEYAQRSVKVRSHRFSQVLTIFDIDDLKAVNDTHGFAVGDRTIVSLVQIIKKVFRHTEIIGRVGGDEIAVLDDSLTVADSVQVTNGLLESFAQVPHKAGGQFFRVTASAGVAYLQGEGNLQTLYERASLGLKRAKEQGKNQVGSV